MFTLVREGLRTLKMVGPEGLAVRAGVVEPAFLHHSCRFVAHDVVVAHKFCASLLHSLGNSLAYFT